MYRTIILALLITASTSCAEVDDDLLKRSAVKTLHAVPGPGPGVTTIQSGSGTIIRVEEHYFWVLSCAHVARHGGEMAAGDFRVVVYGGRVLPAELLYWSTVRDLSIIRVEAETGSLGITAAKICDGEACSAGQKLVKCGFPGGGPRNVRSGEVLPITAWADQACTIPVLVSSLRARSGDSGGGIFRSGKLVAVLYATSEDGLEASCSPAANIRHLLRVAVKRERAAGTYRVPAALGR